MTWYFNKKLKIIYILHFIITHPCASANSLQWYVCTSVSVTCMFLCFGDVRVLVLWWRTCAFLSVTCAPISGRARHHGSYTSFRISHLPVASQKRLLSVHAGTRQRLRHVLKIYEKDIFLPFQSLYPPRLLSIPSFVKPGRGKNVPDLHTGNFKK